MRTSFARTLLSLDSDRFRGSLAAIFTGGILAVVWTSWFVLARVAMYEVSGNARLEVGREPHAVMSLVSGRVVSNQMVLDQVVAEGDVLIELDSDQIRFRLEETRARAAGLRAQAGTLRQEIASQGQAVRDAERAVQSALEEAFAVREQADAAARFATQDAARKESLHDQGLISRAERDAALMEEEQRRSAAQAAGRAVERLDGDRRFEISRQTAALAGLEGRLFELEASELELGAVAARIERELSLHTLRAPVAGRIGDVTGVRVGEVIEIREHLGTVIPAGDVRIVAEFAPHRALGRIQPGQRAQLRLEGFSWVQYGTVPATVERVGKEPRNDTVRVELSLSEPKAFPVPLSHGLPGTLEVEVERLSPAALVLRAAGRTVSRPVSFESR